MRFGTDDRWSPLRWEKISALVRCLQKYHFNKNRVPNLSRTCFASLNGKFSSKTLRVRQVCTSEDFAQTMRLHTPLFEEAFFWYFSFSKEKYETRPPRPPHPSRPILPLLHYPPLPSERPPWGGAWFRWRGARRARSDQRHGEISRWSRKASGDRGRRACRTPR